MRLMLSSKAESWADLRRGKVLNRPSVPMLQSRRLALLVAITTSIVVAFLARYLWTEWTLFALAIAGFYLVTGGFRLMPWRTPLRKAISVGTFIGFVLATIEWICAALQ
jgi:hypothetical protein